MSTDTEVRIKIITATVVAAVGLALIGAGACSDGDRSSRVLRDAGYEDIETHGYRHFGCGTEDSVRTGFTATGPSGEQASGAVCCGWVTKACTIRHD